MVALDLTPLARSDETDDPLTWSVVIQAEARSAIVSEGLTVEAVPYARCLLSFGGYNGKYQSALQVFKPGEHRFCSSVLAHALLEHQPSTSVLRIFPIPKVCINHFTGCLARVAMRCLQCLHLLPSKTRRYAWQQLLITLHPEKQRTYKQVASPYKACVHVEATQHQKASHQQPPEEQEPGQVMQAHAQSPQQARDPCSRPVALETPKDQYNKHLEAARTRSGSLSHKQPSPRHASPANGEHCCASHHYCFYQLSLPRPCFRPFLESIISRCRADSKHSDHRLLASL